MRCSTGGSSAARSIRARSPERRGESSVPRPRGSAGVDARRQRRRDDVGSAADRAHPRARHRRAGDLGHGHRRRIGGAAAAARRDPPVCTGRHAAVRRPLPQSLAARSRPVRGIRLVAQPDHGERRGATFRSSWSTGACRSARSSAGGRCRARSARCSAASTSASRNRPKMPRVTPASARRATSPPAISSSMWPRRRPIPRRCGSFSPRCGTRPIDCRCLDASGRGRSS